MPEATATRKPYSGTDATSLRELQQTWAQRSANKLRAASKDHVEQDERRQLRREAQLYRERMMDIAPFVGSVRRHFFAGLALGIVLALAGCWVYLRFGA